jgi:hypothetical protein
MTVRIIRLPVIGRRRAAENVKIVSYEKLVDRQCYHLVMSTNKVETNHSNQEETPR